MATVNLASVKTGARQLVLSCVDAINREDFDSARRCVSDDMQFAGVLGSRDGADAYFNDMKKMKLKYDVKKAFEEGDDVCLLYDLQMGGTTIFGCGWYHVENNRIKSLRVIFDPRPILEKSGK
ncbi:MAG: nuclear transport factor 2 family protein [Bacteroidetes bacterium]|nr:nuclear transport factor 2 family protein [Bacteroidota bacterium]